MRLVLALLLLASPAWGATYWVSPTGTSGASGADSSANAKSLAWAVSNAAPGDIIRFKSGTYSSGITNPSSGTLANRVFYYGFESDPTAVSVDGIDFASRDYVTVKWMMTHGGLSMSDNFDGAVGDSVHKVRVTNSITAIDFMGDDLTMDYVTVDNGSIGAGIQPKFIMAYETGTNRTLRNRITNSTFNVNVNVSGSTGCFVYGMQGGVNHVIANNTFNITVAGTDDYFFTVGMYKSYYNLFQGNTFNIHYAGSIGNSNGVVMMRDTSSYNRFFRNTFNITGLVKTNSANWTNSGSASASTANNYFGFNVWKSSGTPFGVQNGLRGDTLESNLFAVSSGKAFVDVGSGSQNFNNVIIRHNTFYGTTAPLIDFGSTTASGTSRFASNIAYLAAANGSTAIVSLPAASGVFDSAGVAFSRGGTASAYYSYGGTTGTPGSGGNFGISGKAVPRTPRFVDSTFATLDVGISALGYARAPLSPSLQDGFAGVFSDSIGGQTASSDVTVPSTVADLAVTAMANGQATLTWTAPGDDGSAGTASSYDIRYSTSAINSGNFASATPLTGEPSPSVAGSAESWQTDAVLSSGTTYHFAMTASDETANTSDVSNSPSAAMPDYIRPNIPIITARYYAPGTAVVTFTAVGDDSLTGTATSYDLRYGLGTTWWASSALWETAGLQARTYRYDLEGTPKAAGSADSIYVWGLQPGQIYNFMLRVSDEAGNPSGYSNGDTVAIPSQVERDTEPYPRIGIYGGAGASPQIGSYPLTNVAATDIQTAYIDSLARYPVVSLSPNFTDDSSGTAPRHLAFAAIRRLRAVNPAIILLGEPLGNVAYVGNRWSADTAKAFAYYPKIAKALDHATGDSLKFIMSTSGGGQIVTNGSDATTSFLIRKATAPYKHMMWDVERASTFGGQGGTLSNVDITDPRVRDSLTAVNVRHFVSRTDPLTGAYAYDGIMFDLHQPDFYSVVTAEGDTPDWTRLRRGFASRAAFDSAWVESHHLLMRQLRKACIQAGRPDFILTGNSRSGIATATMNGWMREGWPLQQGGSWATNLRWVPGGQANDDAAFGWKPQMSWVFRSINNQVASGDSIPTDSTAYTEQHFRDYRFGLATACLTGARFVLEPSDAALARAGVLPRWYGAWWFDESAAEDGVSGSLKSGVGWLGQPTARFRQTSPLHGSGTGRHNLADSQGGIGDFDDAGDMSSWSLSGSGTQGLVSRVVDTTYAGAGALRIRIGTRQSVDWQAGGFSTQDGNYTSGDTVSIEFWGRASGRLPISVGLRDSATGSNRLDTSQGTKVWFDTTWTHHRLIGTVNATFSGAPYFWAGDTTGTWHIDEVRVIRGRPRGGLYYREFDNGIVVVNPYASRDSFVTTRAVRRLVGLTGRASSVNDGTVYANGASIPIAAGDALFLYNDNSDTTPPDAVTDLDTLSCSASTISLTWTAPGDDGSLGTATSYDVRYSTSAATLSAWSGATQASPHAPSGAGDPDSLTIANLSPNTTYYFAIRTSDEVPNESAQSLTLVTTTRASGADATRPGPLSVASVGRGLTSLTLRWTAVGDDSLTGQAQTYDLRRSTSAINAGNFGSATQLTGEPTPGPAGSIEQYVATGLTKNTTYYFGLIVSDEAGLPSALATTSATTRLTAGRLRWYNPWTWIRSLFLP